MSLTVGNAPFSRHARGRFNFTYDGPEHVLFVERSPKKLRLEIGGRTIAETTGAVLLHETGHLPVYYLPRNDVDPDVLEPTDHHTTCPFKGDADYFTLRVGDEIRENAVWTYPAPLEGAPDLSAFVAFYWDRVDAWYEEGRRVFVHPRDPYHLVEALESDRHVVVEVGGERIAESTSAVMLFETGLPPRFYLPERDVDHRFLRRTDTQTRCPYKGVTTRYYTIEAGGETVEDAVWVYDQPIPFVLEVAGRFAFYNEKVDLIVDGERWDRPDDSPFA